jgi:hypothetical protein
LPDGNGVMDSRREILAALKAPGGQDVEPIASEELARIHCGPGANPRRIVSDMRWDLLWVPAAPQRASVDLAERTMRVVWCPDDWTANMLIGCSRAAFAQRGQRATPADEYRLAGHFAQPGFDRFAGLLFPDLIEWFAQALRRGVSIRDGSGVWPAVRPVCALASDR